MVFWFTGLGMIMLVDTIVRWGEDLALLKKGLMAGTLAGHLVAIKVVLLVWFDCFSNCFIFDKCEFLGLLY